MWFPLAATFPYTKTHFSQLTLLATLLRVEGRRLHIYYHLNAFVRNPAAGWFWLASSSRLLWAASCCQTHLPNPATFLLLVAAVEVSPLLYSVSNFHKACRNLIILETSSAHPNVGWNKPQFRKGYRPACQPACQPHCLKKPGWKCGGKPAQNQKPANLLITITIKLGH